MIGKISYIMKRTGDNTKFIYKELGVMLKLKENEYGY